MTPILDIENLSVSLSAADSVLPGAVDMCVLYSEHAKAAGIDLKAVRELLRHLQRLPLSYYSGSRTGELISRVTNDSMMVERAVSSVIGDLVGRDACGQEPVSFCARSDCRRHGGLRIGISVRGLVRKRGLCAKP